MKFRQYLIILLSGLMVVLIDQTTKYFAFKKLRDSIGVFVINTRPVSVSLQYSLNQYLSFSIPAPPILIIIAITLMIIGLAWLFNHYVKQQKFYHALAIFILISAALSNLADRILLHGVVDFISFRFFNFQWAIFNLADVFITASILFWLGAETEILKLESRD